MAGVMVTMVAALALACGQPDPCGGEQSPLLRDVEVLAADGMEGRGTGTAGAARARTYIEGRLREIGLEPRSQAFDYRHRDEARQGVNVWTMVRGRTRPDRTIVITAHYDHVGIKDGAIHNGADDNASGVAALLAIAAELKANPPEHSVVLAALDAEELGLYGAKAIVAAPPVPAETIMLNINMDMVSRGKEGVLWAVGTGHNPALRPVLERAARSAQVSVRFGHDQPGTGPEDWTLLSDHGPFHQAGIPFVYFGVDDHPDYHKPTDDAERMMRAFSAARWRRSARRYGGWTRRRRCWNRHGLRGPGRSKQYRVEADHSNFTGALRRPFSFGAGEKAMVEVKDNLEGSFAAIEQGHVEAEALRAEVAQLRSRLEAGERPMLSGAKSESSPFVERYLRRGLEHGVELKAMSGATDAAGGYAVPEEIDAAIERTLSAISPIRAIATVVKVGSAGYRKLVTSGGTPSGWASETGARNETGTPTFHEVAPPSGDLYANPAASQAMLDDAAFNVEAWLADEIGREFARAEGAAFVSGNGANKPRGFLAAAATDQTDGVRAFGTLQFIKTGAAGAFPASNPQDKLIDLVQALRSPYRQGAVFVMNSATAALIRKFKTQDGAFLWQPGLVANQPDTLLGYPVVEAEDMPDVAADSTSIAFGNFKAGYLIAERTETQILRDPFTNKPFVHFYATRRVGGQVMNSEAIKLLKFSA